MIYFVRASNGKGPIKIGTTRRLTVRLKQLEAQYKKSFSVLAVTDGGQKQERQFHIRFAHLRINKFHLCEWFNPEPDLIEFITSACRAWDGLDEIGPGPRKVSVVFDFSPKYRKWLQGFSKHLGFPRTLTIDRALRELAKRHGYAQSPERY